MQYPDKANPSLQKVDLWFPGAGDDCGYSVSFQGDTDVLKSDSGAGRPTPQSEKPLNCTLDDGTVYVCEL